MSATRPKVWEDSDGTPTKVRLTSDAMAVNSGIDKGHTLIPAGTECWVICLDPDDPGAYVLETCDTERPIMLVMPDQYEAVDTPVAPAADDTEESK